MKSCTIEEDGSLTHNMKVVNDHLMKCYCGHLVYKYNSDMKSFIKIKECGNTITHKRNGKYNRLMKKWRIDFTIERYGDMVVEAVSEEEALKIFDKNAREQLKFTHGCTYDWDVKVNYAVETKSESLFKHRNLGANKFDKNLTRELISPMYSEMEPTISDPLVSYLPKLNGAFCDGPNDLPWVQ